MLGKCHLCAEQCQKLQDLKLAYTLFMLHTAVHTAHACGHVVHDFWLSGAMLYQLSYEASPEAGQMRVRFIPVK